MNGTNFHFSTITLTTLSCGAFYMVRTVRFDDLLFKDFSRTFQGLLTIFNESISTSTISHLFHSHSKKATPISANNVIQPKDRIV